MGIDLITAPRAAQELAVFCVVAALYSFFIAKNEYSAAVILLISAVCLQGVVLASGEVF